MNKIVLKEELIVKLSGGNINSLEQQIKIELRKKGKKMLEEAVEKIEEKAAKKKKKKCGCSGKWRNKGRSKNTINSMLGPVNYTRTRLRCQKCGKEYYPFDEYLGINPETKATVGLKEQSLYLSTDTAYDRASEMQEKLTGVKVSGRQIQNWAKEEGARIKEKASQERKEIFDKCEIPENEETRDRVFVQVDGIFVKNRKKSISRSMECKVGIIYSKKVKVSKNRMKILDKRTYATTHGVETFREEFIAECNRWGVWEAKELLFVGDGAAWIKRICSEDFTDAVYLLDFWHLAKNISRALGEEHKTASENWIREVRENYDSKKLLERIKAMSARVDDRDRKKKIRDLYDYVKSNEDGINNWKKVNYLGASGAIEKTVDVAVARRFKLRGMSWRHPGLSSLLALRVLKLNGEWDSYWNLRGVAA
jgi:hypothetical protein